MKTNETTPISQGYKMTSLGVIPQDWEVKRLKNISRVVTGNTPSTSDMANYGNKYFFVSPVDLSENKYIYNTEKKLSLKGYSLSRQIPAGAVLFTCIGSTIGKMGITISPLTCNQQINAIICNSDISNEYVYYELSNRAKRIKLLAGEQAVPIINKSDFENSKILLPPFSEQQKIAEVLGTWDKAIEMQTQLIKKLELRKKGLMQQLLTGKKRLPGFNKKWEKIKLGKIGKFDKGFGVPKDSIKENGNKAITYGEIYTKYNYVIKNVASYIDDETASISKKITRGAILFTGSGETLEDIGKCVAFIDNDVAYAGGDIIIFNPSIGINSVVLSYCLNSSPVNAQKWKYGQGFSVVHIYKKDLAKIQIEIPSLEEQTAIAQVLTAADHEIELAQQKLELLRQQKRGLMQQLLTGKKRVKL